MGFLAQLLLLTRKNLLVMWRTKFWVFSEFLMCLLCLPILALILKFNHMDEHAETREFRPGKINGNFSDLNRRFGNDSIMDFWCNTSKTLAYSFVGDANAELELKELEERFTDKMKGEKWLQLKQFKNVSEMQKALKDDRNDSAGDECNQKYLGGFLFTVISESPQRLSYRMLLPRPEYSLVYEPIEWHLDAFWRDGVGVYESDRDPFSGQTDNSSDVPDNPPYWPSGILSVQFAIHQIFAEKLVGHTNLPEMDVSLRRMPYPRSQTNLAVLYLSTAGPFVWVYVVLVPLLHIAKNIILEKEAGIKTYMTVMGLHPMAFYASHALIGAFTILFVVGTSAVLISSAFTFVSVSLFVLLALLYAVSCIQLTVLFCTFTQKGQLVHLMVGLSFQLLGLLSWKFTPSLHNVGRCLFASLNPVAAFGLGVQVACTFETRMFHLDWLHLFSGSFHQFSFGFAMLMLLFDSALFGLLTFYLDSVWPTDESPRRHPLFFLQDLGFKLTNYEKVAPYGEDEDGEESVTVAISENTEPETEQRTADIDVRGMSKVWESTGLLAVKSLSFRAYRGKVFVLLGHNGAGKSTTFAVLTGSVRASGGDVLICGQQLEHNLRDCQRRIGFCPQYNPLFDKLTVREHLQIYGRMKLSQGEGADELKRQLDTEIAELAAEIGIGPQLETMSTNLSGGQKRKLCLAMALVGRSPVVLLDEPTAGMDPGARHEAGKMLEKIKRDRTILLTTHYMEEANTLGDRIGIMVQGRLVCNGSPEFLKHRFGVGYVLSVVVRSGADFPSAVDKVFGAVANHSPGAKLEQSQKPPEFSIVLPLGDKRKFGDIFAELEQRKEELEMNSFGVSSNTLEQVFLKVGEQSAEETKGEGPNSVQESMQMVSNELFSRNPDRFGLSLLFFQLVALFHRQFLWTLRNPLRSLFPFFLALTIFVPMGLWHEKGPTTNVRSFGLDKIGQEMTLPLQILLEKDDNATWLTKAITDLAAAHPSLKLLHIDRYQHLDKALLDSFYHWPPLGVGAVISRNQSNGKLNVQLLFNGATYHGPEIALNLLGNAMLRNASTVIQPSIELYGDEENPFGKLKDLFKDVMGNMGVAMSVITAFSIMTATMVMPLVEERGSRFKHQLLLTRLHPLVYWASVLLWNFVLYSVFCLVIGFSLFFFNWMRSFLGSIALLWLLYFWVTVPMVGCASFLFEKATKAFSALMCWFMVGSMLTTIGSALLRLNAGLIGERTVIVLNMLLGMALPTKALSSGILNLAMIATYQQLIGQHFDDSSLFGSAGPVGELWKEFRRELYAMGTAGVFFWFLLALLQSRRVAWTWHKMTNKFAMLIYGNRSLSEEDEDEDVREERERMLRETNESHALAVMGLTKFYRRFCAVREITFGVQAEECFGLLGVNGAGKTTTFDLLAGIQYASGGSAVVAGRDVKECPRIGYCPQFDALPGEMTGREVLTLLMRLNGFRDSGDRVTKTLWAIRMEGNADKQTKQFSGGQRRRLSVGIALCCGCCPLVILDEPTAGIDPVARRHIWQLIQAARERRMAMVLSSHSMDECEMLCSRIGLMNAGKLIGLGSSQHLKSKFGNSFLLFITVANPCHAIGAQLDEMVRDAMDSPLCQDPLNSATLRWELARQEGTTWSMLFKRAQALADQCPVQPEKAADGLPQIVDFSLTQNSLEQVFLRLTNLDE